MFYFADPDDAPEVQRIYFLIVNANLTRMIVYEGDGLTTYIDMNEKQSWRCDFHYPQPTISRYAIKREFCILDYCTWDCAWSTPEQVRVFVPISGDDYFLSFMEEAFLNHKVNFSL